MTLEHGDASDRPCPFCGDEFNRKEIETREIGWALPTPAIRLMCKGCYAYGPPGVDHADAHQLWDACGEPAPEPVTTQAVRNANAAAYTDAHAAHEAARRAERERLA